MSTSSDQATQQTDSNPAIPSNPSNSPPTSPSPPLQQRDGTSGLQDPAPLPAWKHLAGFEELSQSWPEASPTPDASLQQDRSLPEQIQHEQDEGNDGRKDVDVKDELLGSQQNQPDNQLELASQLAVQGGTTSEMDGQRHASGESNSQSTAGPSRKQQDQIQKGDEGGDSGEASIPVSRLEALSPTASSNGKPSIPWSDRPRYPTGFSRPSSNQKHSTTEQQEEPIEKDSESTSPIPSSSQLQPGPSNPSNRKPSGDLNEPGNVSSISPDDDDSKISDRRDEEAGEVGYEEAIRRKLGEDRDELHSEKSRNLDLDSGGNDDGNDQAQSEDYSQDFEPQGAIEGDAQEVIQTPLPPRRRERSGISPSSLSLSLEEENQARSSSPDSAATATMTMTMELSRDEDQGSQRFSPVPTPLRRRQRSDSFDEEGDGGISSFASESDDEEAGEEGGNQAGEAMRSEQSLPHRVDPPERDDLENENESQSISQSTSQSFVDAPSRVSFSQSRDQDQETSLPQPPSPTRSISSSEAKLRGPSENGTQKEIESERIERDPPTSQEPDNQEETSFRDPPQDSALSREKAPSPQIRRYPSSAASEQSLSDTTAQENEETFIHREDVSDLPPMFQPQWKKSFSPTKDLLTKKLMLESMWEGLEDQKGKGKEEEPPSGEDQTLEKGGKSPPKILMEAPQPKTHIAPSTSNGKVYLSEEARRAKEEASLKSKPHQNPTPLSPIPSSSPVREPPPSTDSAKFSIGQHPNFLRNAASTPAMGGSPAPAIFKFSSNQALLSTPAKPLRILKAGNTPANMARLRGKVARAAERESLSPVKQAKKTSPANPTAAQEEWSNGNRERKRTRLDKPPSGLLYNRGSSGSLSPHLERREDSLNDAEKIDQRGDSNHFNHSNHSRLDKDQPRAQGRDYVKAGASFMAKRSAYATDTLSFTPSLSQRADGSAPFGTLHEDEDEELESDWEDQDEDEDEEEEEAGEDRDRDQDQDATNEAETKAVEEQVGFQQPLQATDSVNSFNQSRADESLGSRVTRSGRDAPTPNASRDAAVFYSAPALSNGSSSPRRLNARKVPQGRGEESLAKRAERWEAGAEAGNESPVPETSEHELDSHTQAQSQAPLHDVNFQQAHLPDSSQDSIPTPPHPNTEALSSRVPISISHGSFPSSSSTKESFLRRSAIGKGLRAAERDESPRKTLRSFNAAYAAEEEFKEEKARDDLIEQKEEEERLEKWRRRRQEEERQREASRIEEERRAKAFKASWAAQNRAEMERDGHQLVEDESVEAANQRAPGPQTIQVHQSFSGDAALNRSPGSRNDDSFRSHGSRSRVISSGSISALPAAKSDAQMLAPSESAIESPTKSSKIFAVTPSQASQAFRSASNENLHLRVRQSSEGSEQSKSPLTSSSLFGSRRFVSGNGSPVGITNILPDDPIFVEEADRIASENRRVWDAKSKSWVKDKSRTRKGLSHDAFRQSEGGLLRPTKELPAPTPIGEVSQEDLGDEGRSRHQAGVSQTVLNRINNQDNGTDTSDSTSPFKDFSSFGTNVDAQSRGESQTPQAQPDTPSINSHGTPVSSSIVSAPIPSVAISAPSQPSQVNSSAPLSLGRAHVGIPKSGSTLRNELKFSSRETTRETTRDSAEEEAAGLGTWPSQAPSRKDLRETPEKLYSGGSQPELEGVHLVTPSKTGGVGSTYVTPQPPRSILKSAPGSNLRPGVGHPLGNSLLGNSPSSLFDSPQPGRSISFADGRRTGRMLDDNQREVEGAFSSNQSALGKSEEAEKTAVVTNLLQQLADLSFGEGQFSAALLPRKPGPPSISFTGGPGNSTPPRAGAFSNRGESINAGSPWNVSRGKLGRSDLYEESIGDRTYLTEASFAVARDQMLVLLTDVHPWVEEWDKLEKIDLRRRKVGNLVRLKDFLPIVEEVQVDNNDISFFTGLPSSVRLLTASHNKISNVTSFHHLINLETLDLSHNDIDSLSALSGLSHLRELRVNDNHISSIEGIEDLKRLVSLSLRGNQIQSFDAGQTKWRKLVELDLSHNHLVEVAGLSTLHSLKTLNLDHNQMDRLDLESLPHLRVLRVCDNVALSSLDVLPVAKLRTLYADFCSIQTIDNLGALSRLQDFSLRMQGVAGLIWPAHELRDAKRLFFSGNAFPGGLPNAGLGPASGPSSPLKFYNLVYLELASCQLTALPADLPELAPNMRSLNADHNHFETLPPLQKMHRLKRLSLFGCGIRKLSSLTKALVGMEELQTLDVRCNPCSHGFYPPITMPGGPMSPSHPIAPSRLAPIPNPAVVQPDVAEEAAAQEMEKEAEARRAIEMSFFHKRVPNLNTPSSSQHAYGSIGAASSAIYSASDERFSSTLPPHIARRRLLHRGMLAMACQSLTWLDGLMIDEQEVLHADEEITRSEMRQKRSRSSNLLMTDSD